MEKWKVQLVALAFIAVGLTSGAEEERTRPQHWQADGGLTDSVVDLMKRSKALRFYGLMGKRSGTKKQFQVKRRNKGETFVGLMGRSVSSDESPTRVLPAGTNTEKPHRQGSRDEWIPILY